ncbi:MAG: hypothetical protein EKK57_07540 [Proteobacteria bacterium]|nr:MAG: hypothetical protein EKK57_07540 [Pseudomonadota bacterium]
MPTLIPENKKVYILLELIDQINNRIEFRLFRVLFWKINAISNEVVPFIASEKYADNLIIPSELRKDYMHMIQHGIFTEVSDNHMQYKVAELAVEYKNLPVDLYYYMDDICYAYNIQETE